MLRSLFAGISGLRNFQIKMDVIGNNIANVNTVGFKGSRISFAEAISQRLAGERAPTERLGGINPMQVGLGVHTLGIDTNFNQGALESTSVLTDLAIQGNGFFMVSDGEKTYYTRAGTFTIDAEGNLVTHGTGMRVMGYMSDGAGDLDRTTTEAIQIPLGRRSQPKSTTEVVLYGNLDMNMTKAIASLTSAGDTGITFVSGTAADGVGGTHSIEITGSNATRSTATGVPNGMALNDTLGDLGVSDVTGFSVTIDNDQVVEIVGLSTESTISDLIRALNTQVQGVEARLEDDGSISITRDYYGNGAQYNVQLNDGDQGSDIVANLFDDPGDQDGIFDANSGLASTLSAMSTFTPTGSEETFETVLELETDERTGLVVGLTGLADGGVSIRAPEGLAAGTAVISTEDTTHSTSIFVYDSMGNTHNLNINFTRSAEANTWNWTAELPEPASIYEGGSGQIRFANDGSLENFTYDGDASKIVIDPGNSAQNIELTINPGTFGELDGLTQTASTTSSAAIGQDGYGMGILQNISIDYNGRIFGNYSNGVTEILAQVLLADIINPQGLEHIGENLYCATLNSGSSRIIDAEQAGSRINSGYLEMSNVDLAREFTEMILAQRAFQASARMITTSDMMLQEVTSLKR